ncbi:MAG TPA: hypothetical protein VN038_01480 [Dyadobacter sp.]|nr:hypothetical protein [Dyadobacter sp.]
MSTEQLTTLRNRKPLSLFDSKEKLFVKIQINRKESFVCWERWVSKDRNNWVNWNLYLSLKDVRNILNDLKRK